MSDTSHDVTDETPEPEPVVEAAARTGFARVVHSRAAAIFFASLWWLYGLWLAFSAYLARDADWLWLVYAGFAAGILGGLLVTQVRWFFDRSSEVARVAGGVVAIGLAVAGLAASEPRLAILLVVAMAGPALLAWLAERNARLQDRHERLKQEIRLADIQLSNLKQGERSADALMVLMKGNLELMKIAALNEVRRPTSGPPVAGRRRHRQRRHHVHAAWDAAQAQGEEAATHLRDGDDG